MNNWFTIKKLTLLSYRVVVKQGDTFLETKIFYLFNRLPYSGNGKNHITDMKKQSKFRKTLYRKKTLDRYMSAYPDLRSLHSKDDSAYMKGRVEQLSKLESKYSC